MIINSPLDETRVEPADALDRLLSDYFKAQLKEPWPAAPRPPAAEPLGLVAERATVAEALRPLRPTRDTDSRARYTLAASVALLLGACWYLSSGLQSTNRTDSHPARGGILNDAGASKPAPLEEIKHHKATGGEKTLPRIPMQLP